MTSKPVAREATHTSTKLRQKWEIYDTLTGELATTCIFPSREWARYQIQTWREQERSVTFLDTRPARL